MEAGKKQANTDAVSNLQLTIAEEKLINLIREIRYGEVRIIVNDSVPVRADEIRKQHKL